MLRLSMMYKDAHLTVVAWLSQLCVCIYFAAVREHVGKDNGGRAHIQEEGRGTGECFQ